MLLEDFKQTSVWINDLYQVARREFQSGSIHLNIRRRDGRPIFRDWRHFQEIKNQLAGPEREAMEIYPAESRLVDTSNKYHLWVMPEGVYITDNIGFSQRDVSYVSGPTRGTKQRPKS